MKRQKILIIIAGLFALSLLGGCNSDNSVAPVIGDIPVQAAATSNNITVTGVVESVEKRNVYSTLGNIIRQVNVEVGDHVTEGQILAVLDTNDLTRTIEQQRTDLQAIRKNSQDTIRENKRVLNEAHENLVNNTNIQILSAEAELETAELNLAAAQRDYDIALKDYREGNNPQIINAESALRETKIELETRETNHENLTILHNAGVIPLEELRQSENALISAQNSYNDALANYENTTTALSRNLDQLESSLLLATAAHGQANEFLNLAHITAQQEIEKLRSNVTSAEVSADLMSSEIALQILESQLKDSEIEAPISGVVTAVFAKEGAVGSGLLFVIEDTDNLRIITSFREYDIGRIEPGMEVIITPTGTESSQYTGIISRINPAATSLSSPVVEFEAEVAVTSEETNLRIGMNTRLNIVLE